MARAAHGARRILWPLHSWWVMRAEDTPVQARWLESTPGGDVVVYANEGEHGERRMSARTFRKLFKRCT